MSSPWQIVNLSCQPKNVPNSSHYKPNRSFELFQWNLHDIKKTVVLPPTSVGWTTCGQYKYGGIIKVSIWAYQILPNTWGMHRLLLQAQSSFLDGNHKKCEIICQLYIFFWSLPVVDEEKNLNILLCSDLNVPGELHRWLILYWALVSDTLVVVS
jgi:hypothetical protein